MRGISRKSYHIRNERAVVIRPSIGVKLAITSLLCGFEMTALLIHGRGALDYAYEEASKYKTFYEYGGETLSTDAAREAIDRMSYPLVGINIFAVLIGAVDKARGSATDALLKGIEEHDDFVTPILWATSLSEVPKTIRSRCRVVWADERESQIKEEYIRLARNSIAGNYANVIVQLNEIKEKPFFILSEVGNALSKFDFSQERVTALWENVRLALRQEYSMSKNELLGVLCF